MAALPPFFKPALPLTKADREWFNSNITGWNKLHRQLATLTERQLLVAILLEIEGKKRPEIIGRCLKRFDALRRQRELKELWNVAPKAGLRGQSLA